jgi:hypothetical protein
VLVLDETNHFSTKPADYVRNINFRGIGSHPIKTMFISAFDANQRAHFVIL